jgi:hypothetical protein
VGQASAGDGDELELAANGRRDPADGDSILISIHDSSRRVNA